MKNYLRILLILLCAPVFAREMHDVPYHALPNVDPQLLSMDIYWPSASRDKDVVIMIHGGSWQRGDKTNNYIAGTKVDYFTGKGIVYVATNYRLSPAVKMPEHPRDVARAIAHVHSLLPDARIWLVGHSSGAHLAALVATNEAFLGEQGLDLRVLSGVVCLDTKYVDVLANSRLRTFNRVFIDKVFGDDRSVWNQVDPIQHIAPDKGIPPILLFFTEQRLRKKINEKFAATLARAGVPSRAILARGYDHKLMIVDFGSPGDPLTGLVGRFIDREDVRAFPGAIRR